MRAVTTRRRWFPSGVGGDSAGMANGSDHSAAGASDLEGRSALRHGYVRAGDSLVTARFALPVCTYQRCARALRRHPARRATNPDRFKPLEAP